MPTQSEFATLKEDLDKGLEAVRTAYNSVSNWATGFQSDVGEAVAADIDDRLDQAARLLATTEEQMGNLIGIAEERRLQCKKFTDEYSTWFQSTGWPKDWDDAPTTDLDYVEYGW